MQMKKRCRLSNIETKRHAALPDFDQHHHDSGGFLDLELCHQCVNRRFCICGTGVSGGSLPAERTGIG